MDWLVGIIIVVTGVAMLRYRYPIYHFTGEWGWAQKYLGSNGTVVAIALIGALLIFVGVAFPLGAFKNTRTNVQVPQTQSTSENPSNQNIFSTNSNK